MNAPMLFDERLLSSRLPLKQQVGLSNLTIDLFSYQSS